MDDPEIRAALAEADRRGEEAREFSRQTSKLLEALGRQPAPAKRQRDLADEFAEVLSKQFAAAGIRSVELYKNHLQPRPQPQPRGVTTMSPEQLRRWNEDQHIYTAINKKWETELTDMVLRWIKCAADQLVGDIEKAFDEERAYTNKEIEALKAEVAALRADLNVQVGVQRGEIREIKTLRGEVPRKERDVA